MLSATILQNITEYRLRFSRPLRPHEATVLRGFFGGAFADEILLHHHEPGGGFRYVYPRVQFKVLNRTAHLIGIEEGGDLVTQLWAEVDRAQFGLEVLPVLEGTIRRRREPLGQCAEPVEYRFLSPWLGLNQDNFQAYQHCEGIGARQALLERVLVGNCLSLAKAFGYDVTCRLTADARGLWPVDTHLKGVPMLGFCGSFRINFLVPGLLGLGKSVSRGFGTVERKDAREEN